MGWIKHAFAVTDDRPAEPQPQAAAFIDRTCRKIVRYHMTMPALVMLDLTRPLNYLAAQTLHGASPVATTLLNPETYGQFASFLEHRGSYDYLRRRIEAVEEETQAEETQQAASSAEETATETTTETTTPKKPS